MARQIFEENGASAGSTGNGSGGGNANVYITIPNVDIKEILLIGTQAVVRVSASTFDIDNRVVFFDLRVGNTQMLLDAVKDGKMWTAEYIFTVTGQSGDRLAIFCNAIDQNNLRSMTGTPSISPRLTQSRIAAPVITSPTQDEYKTAGSIVIKGTEFVSLGASDTHKAVHGRVVLADDPQVVRWEGSLAGALTQITAAWTPAGDGQEDLLCSLAYEGYSGGMGEWSEPVRVRLVKSGVSVPVIVWPLNGEKYADPNLLRCNAEQPAVKSNSWTGTEWQVSELKDFSILTVAQTVTDMDYLINRLTVSLSLGGMFDKRLYIRCRHTSSIGPTDWSESVLITTAQHQTFWEMYQTNGSNTRLTGTFNPPTPGVYEILCVGGGGDGGGSNHKGGAGGGGSGYLSKGNLYLDSASYNYSVGKSNETTSFGTIVANPGESGGFCGTDKGAGGNGGGGPGRGNDWATVSKSTRGGIGASSANGVDGSNQNPGAGGGEGHGLPGTGTSYSGTGGFGLGAGGGGGSGFSNGVYGSGGGGAGGYGGGLNYPQNNYYSKHKPYICFHRFRAQPSYHQSTDSNGNQGSGAPGYIRIMYKGPIGEGA